MTVETIRCVPIWSGWVRATHWLMAVGVVFQYVSAQAIAWGASDYDFWREWHMIAGELVLLLLVGRVILAFILPAAASWRAFLPDAVQWQGIKQTLQFYVTWGRAPLPNWFAHNPLWRLLYPVMFLLILGLWLSGLWYNAPISVAGLWLHEWHALFANGLAWLVMGHIIAAIAHDVASKSASISGMLNGVRYFHIEDKSVNKPAARDTNSKAPPVYIAVESIKRKP